MLREVVGAMTAAFIGALLLYFMLPMLKTAYDNVIQVVDTSDPTIQTMITIGDGLYLALPFIAFIVIGYLMFAYATRNLPVDI